MRGMKERRRQTMKLREKMEESVEVVNTSPIARRKG